VGRYRVLFANGTEGKLRRALGIALGIDQGRIEIKGEFLGKQILQGIWYSSYFNCFYGQSRSFVTYTFQL